MKKLCEKKMAVILCWALGAALYAPAADIDYVENSSFSNTVSIAFSGSSATITPSTPAGVTVSQDGANVVITSTVAGVNYLLSGTTTAGSLKFGSAYPFKLTLNGVQLASTDNPAISIRSTNRCFLVLAGHTTNSLADGSSYVENVSGALYSLGPLIFSGTGSLTLTGKGSKKHGIYCNSYIRLRDGEVNVSGAAKDGIHAVSYFRMDNGTLYVTATGDGIDGDDGYVEINGGAVNVRSDVADTRCIKASRAVTLNGGVVNLSVTGLQAKGFSGGDVAINGGTLSVALSGNVYLETVQTVTTNSGTVTTNSYVDPSYCTAIKCDSNLTVTAGTVTITHGGTAGKGISAGGNIVIQGGLLDIVTTGGYSTSFTNSGKVLDIAAADCMKADGNLQVLGGTVNVLSTGNAGDGLSADGAIIFGVSGITNTPCVTAATRGQKVYLSGSGESADYANPKAIKAIGSLTINGGTIRATTKNDGGEGIESKNRVIVNGGLVEITAYDDCINASTNVTINGGMVYCYSLGNDGIDANGTMTINGGTVIASGTTAPEEGFDCDANTFTITGGIMMGTGGASSTPTSSSCTQRSVMYTATGSSGTVIQVKSAGGNVVVYKTPRAYSSGGGGGPGGSGGMVMLFSNSSLVSGTTYYIVTGGTITGGTEFHGYYTGATVTGGTTSKTFTASSMVTSVK